MIDGAKVAVIGGGPAGLSAAWRLVRAGAAVTVFEAKGEVGGRTRTDELDDFRVDVFAQLFGSMYRAFFEVLGEIGGGALAVRSAGRDALWRGGRVHEVTYGSISSMLSSGAVPLGTKLRLGAKYLPFLARHGPHLDLHNLPAATVAGLDDESIASWGERELGREFVEYLAYPLLASYHGVLPEETTAALYHLLAHHGTNVSVYALRGGTGGFCDLLAQQISERGGIVRTHSRIVQVTRTESGGAEGVAVDSEEGSESFDAVAVCIPGTRVAEMVEGLSPEAYTWFGALRYRPLAAVALLLDRPVNARYFGLSFPREYTEAVGTVCVQENKGPDLGLVPPGRGLLVALLTPSESTAAAADGPPRHTVDRVLAELRATFPGLESAVRRAKLYRYTDGGPVFYPGYLRHLRSFPTDDTSGGFPIAFGGDYLVVPGVEGSVVSGLRAADTLIRRAESG